MAVCLVEYGMLVKMYDCDVARLEVDRGRGRG